MVNSGRQKYCPDCKQKESLKWQREHKKEIIKNNPEIMEAKKKLRSERKKICIYCMKTFASKKNNNLCSEYCRKKQKQISYCIGDIKRGVKRDLEKLLKERNQYRKAVLKEK